MMQHNPYDLIIIKENIIPDDHIEELMLLTNNKEEISQATVINRDEKGEDSHQEKLENRNTLWYHIPEEQGDKLQVAISQMYARFVFLSITVKFKSMNLLSSLVIQ